MRWGSAKKTSHKGVSRHLKPTSDYLTNIPILATVSSQRDVFSMATISFVMQLLQTRSHSWERLSPTTHAIATNSISLTGMTKPDRNQDELSLDRLGKLIVNKAMNSHKFPNAKETQTKGACQRAILTMH